MLDIWEVVDFTVQRKAGCLQIVLTNISEVNHPCMMIYKNKTRVQIMVLNVF